MKKLLVVLAVFALFAIAAHATNAADATGSEVVTVGVNSINNMTCTGAPTLTLDTEVMVDGTGTGAYVCNAAGQTDATHGLIKVDHNDALNSILTASILRSDGGKNSPDMVITCDAAALGTGAEGPITLVNHAPVSTTPTLASGIASGMHSVNPTWQIVSAGLAATTATIYQYTVTLTSHLN
jgi:hypothetical protein